MKINFLRCNESLAKQLSEVALASYQAHYLHLWHDAGNWYMHKCFRPEVLLQELKIPHIAFYLILTEGGVMGFLKTQNVDNQEDTLELERIYLRANATGQGIGEQAILFVEKLAKASGKKRLLVKAMDSAADAMRFYQKMGFKEVTRFQLAFPMMKEMYKGMIIMEKCL